MTRRALGLVALVACGTRGILQGETYEPDGTLPIDPPSERVDAASDAPVSDAAPLPEGGTATLPSNTCLTARDLGSASGDQGGTINASGTCAEWVRVRLTEDNSSAIGRGMRAKITLTPQGADLDLYVFFEPGRDEVACSSPYQSSVTPGTIQEGVTLTWGEGTIANASNDGRTVWMAIVKADGPCTPTSGGWTLLVEGNQ